MKDVNQQHFRLSEGNGKEGGLQSIGERVEDRSIHGYQGNANNIENNGNAV